jgi:hypothetical protein
MHQSVVSHRILATTLEHRHSWVLILKSRRLGLS